MVTNNFLTAQFSLRLAYLPRKHRDAHCPSRVRPVVFQMCPACEPSSRSGRNTNGLRATAQLASAWHHLRFSLGAQGGVIVKSINALASHQISAALFEGDGRRSGFVIGAREIGFGAPKLCLCRKNPDTDFRPTETLHVGGVCGAVAATPQKKKKKRKKKK
ncbi:hypothetical protein EYF80_030560 [Liparis tanakae]|uniref:Uncharacterized protein n=1 Tax=Liparis tanakae TaxID=230148 RepID=A0A4Z2GZY3_9TELE|nr:hypothetical protein EYF80_030560 [Liparis tanakae]